MPKFLQFSDRILFSHSLKDKLLLRFYNQGYKSIYCTNSFNYKIAQKYLLLRDDLEPAERLYYLFEHLTTKNYSDYPVYLFLYGNKMLEKQPIISLFLEKEDPNLIRILTKKIEYIIRYKSPSSVIITFDNYHLIRFKLKGQKLFSNTQFDNLYGIRGKVTWINLSKTIRFIDFSCLKFYGTIYDPFQNWKKSFLESYDFVII